MFRGTTELADIVRGTTDIQKVYRGSSLIRERGGGGPTIIENTKTYDTVGDITADGWSSTGSVDAQINTGRYNCNGYFNGGGNPQRAVNSLGSIAFGEGSIFYIDTGTFSDVDNFDCSSIIEVHSGSVQDNNNRIYIERYVSSTGMFGAPQYFLRAYKVIGGVSTQILNVTGSTNTQGRLKITRNAGNVTLAFLSLDEATTHGSVTVTDATVLGWDLGFVKASHGGDIQYSDSDLGIDTLYLYATP